MDLLHQEGCTTGARVMKRLWRAEGLLVARDALAATRGAPGHLRSDNGPEFICGAAKRRCAQSGTGTLYIDPRAPWQDGIVEIVSGRLRDELLSSELFETLAETRYLVDRWRLHYNHRRPQRALGKLTLAAFAAASPAPPPLRLAALAFPAASPDTQRAGTMPTLSQGVDR